MSSTLREQLLKVGLVTEQQVRASEQRRAPSRRKPEPTPEQKLAAQKAQAAKIARDQELNRQRQLAAEAKERAMQIKQLVEQHRLPKVLDSDDRFHFVAGKKLRFILVDAAMREGLNNGSLAIIRYNGSSDVVPAEIAERIRERDPRAVVQLKKEPDPVDENDPYKDFVVPDDLKW